VTVVEKIARALMLSDTVVEATIGPEGSRRYALEAGTRISMIPAVRAARVDSAELIGFIHNTTASRPHAEYDAVAVLIVDRFHLDRED